MLEPKPLEGQQASRETRGVLSVALKIEPGEGRPLAWLVAFWLLVLNREERTYLGVRIARMAGRK